MNWLLVVSFIVTIVEITSYVEEHVNQYFNIHAIRKGAEVWQNHRISCQNMLSMAMHESYGNKGLNVYVQETENPLYISKGYYHNDNQVHLILHDLVLDELPHISDPVVSFPLLANVIKLEAVVGKIIVHASYLTYRNTSSMVFDLREQDQYKTSPFLFEQVKNEGSLAITVEGCKLSGIGITSLTGRVVNLGNTVFRLLHCQHNFEIFSLGVASPPVVANYLPNSEGLNIEHLIMRPLSDELRLKLQAALHAHINTSAIFGESLNGIRLAQKNIFEQTTNYLNNVIRNLNVLTITRNAGKIAMEDFSINWNDTFGQQEPTNCIVTLSEMVLTGLETVYSSHTGGPFKLTSLKISDELRFGTLQVRGTIDQQIGDDPVGMFDFAAEISDVEVDITINIEADDKGPTKTVHVIEVMGWRTLQFSCPGMTFITGEALITGYILTKIPVYLTNYLNNILDEAALEADKEYKSFENDQEEREVLGENDNNSDYNTNLDNGQRDYIEKDGRDYVDIDDGQENEKGATAPLAAEGNLEDKDDDYGGMIDSDDAKSTIQGVSSTDEILDSAVAGLGGIVVDQQITDVPGGRDFGEVPAETPGDTLKHQLFDESMFDTAYDRNTTLRRKKLWMRSQKQRKWHKNVNKFQVRRATRTAKSFRHLTVNEINKKKK